MPSGFDPLLRGRLLLRGPACLRGLAWRDLGVVVRVGRSYALNQFVEVCVQRVSRFAYRYTNPDEAGRLLSDRLYELRDALDDLFDLIDELPSDAA